MNTAGRHEVENEEDGPHLQSFVHIPPGEKPLSEAIATTLQAAPAERAALFEGLARDIETWVAANAPEHP